MADINEGKKQFTDIYSQFISRDGAAEMLEYLNKSDFFSAPASAKFHMAEVGGLCLHSINVYNRLRALVRAEYGEKYVDVYSEETIAVCGLLHDVCKVNYYAIEMRNVKEDGGWVKKPFFKVDERFPYGHGEKSVFIINQYMKLSAEEAMAINWHIGGFDARVLGGSYSLSDAYAKFKLALLLHIADLEATYLDEERGLKM